jgi:hypothetical protein
MPVPQPARKWIVIGLLLLAGGILWKLHTSTSGSDRDASVFAPSDPWTQSSTPTTTGFDSLLHDLPHDAHVSPTSTAGAYGADRASSVGSGLHIAAMPTADGDWRVVGGGPASAGSGTARYLSARLPAAGGGGGVDRGATPSQPARSQPGGSNPPPGYGPAPSGSKTDVPASPPFFGQALFTPLPGAPSRAVAFSEWESYRTDLAGNNNLVTTDDSNFFRDHNGKINGNTGDTDASGLNVTDATDADIVGTTSADVAPWQVDPPDDGSDAGSDDDSNSEAPDPSEPGDAPDENPGENLTTTMMARAIQPSTHTALAAVSTAQSCSGDEGDCPDDSSPPPTVPDDSDFPYSEWVARANRNIGTSIHTDEGTTLASGADALVIGGDGYDDDDNRAAGNNNIITRDDDNVVLGGTGKVNAQIGDSEQGAVIMDVNRVHIQGGGAF